MCISEKSFFLNGCLYNPALCYNRLNAERKPVNVYWKPNSLATKASLPWVSRKIFIPALTIKIIISQQIATYHTKPPCLTCYKRRSLCCIEGVDDELRVPENRRYRSSNRRILAIIWTASVKKWRHLQSAGWFSHTKYSTRASCKEKQFRANQGESI